MYKASIRILYKFIGERNKRVHLIKRLTKEMQFHNRKLASKKVRVR